MTSRLYVESLSRSTASLESNSRAVAESAVCQLRSQFRDKFFEICIVHLSFLIDLPTDFYMMAAKLAEKSDRVACTSTPSRRLLTDQSTKLTGVALSPASSNFCVKSPLNNGGSSFAALKRLMRYLDNDHQLQHEGIFRKTGNVSRVKQLKERLSLCGDQTPLSILKTDNAQSLANTPPVSVNNAPCQTGIQSKVPLFSVHDTVGALKAFLSDFSEPLVTDDLFEIFCDVNAMCQPRTDEHGRVTQLSDEDLTLFDAKRQKAFRLLTLMLPLENRSILYNLLNLLHKTLQHVQQNKMSAEALGTVFAPLIVSPRTISPAEFNAQQKARIIPTTTKMIEESGEIFRIPLDLAHDMVKHLQKLTDGDGVPPSCGADDNPRISSCLLLGDAPSCSTPSDLSRSSFMESFSFQKTPNDAHDDVLDTCVSFAADGRSNGVSTATDHNQVVAELLVQVEALPASKSKTKYLEKLRKFHALPDCSDAHTSNEHLTKSTKRRQLASFLKRIRRTDDTRQDRENKENSHRLLDRIGTDSPLQQANKSNTASKAESVSLEPTKLFAMLVPPKIGSAALGTYCFDDAWDQSSAWPILQSTFVKQNKS